MRRNAQTARSDYYPSQQKAQLPIPNVAEVRLELHDAGQAPYCANDRRTRRA